MDCSTISNDMSNITLDQLEFVEKLQQKLHAANQQLERCTMVNAEMELEVERLLALIDSNESSYQLEKNELSKQFNEKIQSLRCLLEEERAQANSDMAELKEKIILAKVQPSEKDISDEGNALKDQLLSLESEIKELKEQLAESKERNCNCEKINSQLVEQCKELSDQLGAMKEILKVKTDLLQSTNEAFEELKEEKALLTTELMMLKAGPIENKDRGNSLFSEVDTNRQAIKKKLEIMQNKYLEAKKILAIRNNEIKRLKAENTKVQMFLAETESNVKRRENSLLESYRRTNDELRSLIAKLEVRPETPQIVTVSDTDVSNMQWIHTVINKAREETKEMRKSYEKKSCEILSIEEQMYSLTRENTDVKRQLVKEKALTEELKCKLAALESPDNTVTPENSDNNLGKIKSPSEQEKKTLFNSASSKSVRFAEDK